MEMKDLSRLDDELLAGMAARGKEDPEARSAATVLFSRYHRRIYCWARRYVSDREEALDLAQEVMLSAWRHLPSYVSQSRFYVWLFVITRNRCLNALRKPRLLVAEGSDIDALPAGGEDPSREFEEKLDEAEILDLLEQHLDPLEQNAIYLRCFERMSVDTISRTLDITGSTGARTVLQRARQKLRKALERRRKAFDHSIRFDDPNKGSNEQ